MKFRRRPSPLFLLLLPSLAYALTPSTPEIKDPAIQAAGTSLDSDPSTVDLSGANKPRYEIGTKDAPVDGKDGKPHAGPFVSSSDAKTDVEVTKSKSEFEDGSLMMTAEGEKVPLVNDGVMDDPNRQVAKQGTTGTEGGVSEKDKLRKAQEGQTGEKVEMKPDSPKEILPIPNSEAKSTTEAGSSKLTNAKDVDGDDHDEDGLAGLEKPDGLPDKTNKLPNPLPNSANIDHLDITKPGSSSVSVKDPVDSEVDGIIQPFHSFVLSLTMILFSEVGDKTFLIAALMAMKHDRLLVFSAAFSALIAMTVLSAVLGHAVPTLLPKSFTNFLAAGLFLVFGGRLMREGLAMSKDEGVGAEMEEVEMELAEHEHQARREGKRRDSVSPYALEMGLSRKPSRKSRSTSRLPSPPRSPSSSSGRSPSPVRSSLKSTVGGLYNLFSLVLSPIWVQTFVMTFLGEWGDRSQIATIAMAAGQDYWWVTTGAISGHAVCTGVAVIGGRALAGKVSMRVVTLGGAGAFLVFGVIYLFEALYSS